MGDTTKIEWADATWNPVRGCTMVSPGCTNCYAMKQAHRFSAAGQPYEGMTRLIGTGPVWTGKVRFVEEHLADPLRWRRPRRVFVNSMSDLFHEGLSDAEIDRVFAVMAISQRHTFQVLTKRPERMRRYVEGAGRSIERIEAPARDLGYTLKFQGLGLVSWPLPNVWLGVSVEDQRRADERIPVLLDTPAAVRFLSCEPLLGPVDLWHLDGDEGALRGPAVVVDGFVTPSTVHGPPEGVDASYVGVDWVIVGVDWVIVGGESGPGARPFDITWATSLVEQCRAAGVACFVKQLGRAPLTFVPPSGAPDDGGDMVPLRLADPKGGDWDEWPADLRVREFPDLDGGGAGTR